MLVRGQWVRGQWERIQNEQTKIRSLKTRVGQECNISREGPY